MLQRGHVAPLRGDGAGEGVHRYGRTPVVDREEVGVGSGVV